ncbi:MAG: hypothetical protein QW085_07290 [Pyrobaculum sp.]
MKLERWYSFPLGRVEEILRFAGWKKSGRRRSWRRLLEDYCRLDVRGERLYISACGRLFFTLLPSCTEEFKVSVRLSYLAEALEAFEMAGLKPGSMAFTRGGATGGSSPAEGRLAESLHSRSPRVSGSGALFTPFLFPFPT